MKNMRWIHMIAVVVTKALLPAGWKRCVSAFERSTYSRIGIFRARCSILSVLLEPDNVGSMVADITESSGAILRTAPSAWMIQYNELKTFCLEHGHCRVPKRYAKNSKLAHWVSKQRQQYRQRQVLNASNSLSDQRITLLQAIGFCWDASSSSNSQKRADQVSDKAIWWKTLENLHQSSSPPHTSNSSQWLRQQRLSAAMLDSDQIAALDATAPSWNTTQWDRQWQVRFNELQAFQTEQGHTCVPISYAGNRPLALWVARQRQQYVSKHRGQPRYLCDARQAQLDAIGFVWNVWEHVFAEHQQKSSIPEMMILQPHQVACANSKPRTPEASARSP